MEPIESIECRICMDNDERPLLQPCACSTSYVHEECLQRWRRENIENDKYRKCEICSTDYSITRKHQLETMLLPGIELYPGSFMLVYTIALWIGMLVVYAIDAATDRSSLRRLNLGGPPDHELLDAIEGYTWAWTAYYTSYTNFIYSMIFSALFILSIGCRIRRKKMYMIHYGLVVVLYFIYSWSYYILYSTMYSGADTIDMYLDIAFGTAISTPLVTVYFVKHHNKVLTIMNSDEEEVIDSPRYTPLIEISTED